MFCLRSKAILSTALDILDNWNGLLRYEGSSNAVKFSQYIVGVRENTKNVKALFRVNNITLYARQVYWKSIYFLILVTSQQNKNGKFGNSDRFHRRLLHTARQTD